MNPKKTASDRDSTPNFSAHVDAGFGDRSKLPLTGFLVWGLLTCWVYTALKISAIWRAHAGERWREFQPALNSAAPAADAMSKLKAQGFDENTAVPHIAAALLALAAMLIAGWFVSGIVLGLTFDYWTVVVAIGLSSLLFYAGTGLLVLWLARRIEAHELTELLLVAHGAAMLGPTRKLPSAQTAARWEANHNRVALFLILAVPIVASPVIGAHLLLTGATPHAGTWPATMCFVLAAVFHFWGTKLVVGLYNDHLEIEALHSHSGPADDRAVSLRDPAPRETARTGNDNAAIPEPYDGDESCIFISYKRDDLARVVPVMQRLQSWGYRIWYDKGIPGGAEWDALIEQKIKQCALLLFFVSQGSVESKYCRRELKYTDQLNKPILSVRLEPAELGHGLEMLLTQYQMIDVAAEDFSGEIEKALKYLRML